MGPGESQSAQLADGIAADAAGGDAPPAQISRYTLVSKPNTIQTRDGRRARHGRAGSTPNGYLALMGSADTPLLTNH